MLKKLLLLLLIIPCRLLAQDKHTVDSLTNLINKAKEDTAKVRLLNTLSKEYVDIDNKKVTHLANQILTLSNKLNFDDGRANAYNLLGIVADIDSDFPKAIDYYDRAAKLAVNSNDYKLKASLENNVGLIYWKAGDFHQALARYFKGLAMADKYNLKRMQGNILSNIGLVYYDLQQFKKSEEYQAKALVVRRQMNNKFSLATTLNNMSMVKNMLGQVDSGLHYNRQAIAIEKEIKDDYSLAISYVNMGGNFEDTRQYDSCYYYLNKAIAINKKIGGKLGLIHCYTELSHIASVQKKYDQSLTYAQQALDLAKEIKSDERIAKASEFVAVAYANKGDYKTAYQHMREYATFRGKIFDLEKAKKANELEVKYQIEKKDLLFKNNLAELQNEKLKVNQRNLGIVILLILLFTLASIYYLLNNRYKLKQAARLQAEIIHQQDLATKGIIEAEERERKRIAADLHDGVGQLFSTVRLNLGSLMERVTVNKPEDAALAQKTIAMVDESCKEVRSIAHQMMPNILLKTGLASAVKDFISKIDAEKLKVTLETSGLNERLSNNIEIVLYRVIQECVNNVIKHARANRLDIQLDRNETEISVTVEDNGRGFDTTDSAKFEGIGLKNILTRLAYLKGTADFSSSPGRGTLVAIYVPLTSTI